MSEADAELEALSDDELKALLVRVVAESSRRQRERGTREWVADAIKINRVLSRDRTHD